MADPRPIAIGNDKLHIRSPEITDVEAIRAIDLNPANTLHQDHINEQDNTIEAVTNRVKGWINAEKIPDFLPLVITEKSTKRTVGYCGFSEYGPGATVVEAGCVIDSKFSGKGYGTACYKVMFDYAFDGLESISTVKVSTSEDNTAMRHLIEKKFGLEGTLGRDPFGECLVYSMPREKWLQHPRK